MDDSSNGIATMEDGTRAEAQTTQHVSSTFDGRLDWLQHLIMAFCDLSRAETTFTTQRCARLSRMIAAVAK
jgi:hypothetical protein